MKRRITTLEMVLCAMFTALTAIGAFIRIPVPGMDYFTLQFFFVLMAGMLLGSRLGAAAVGIYVLLGLFGLPIFAAGGGIGYIFRPSFGYLLGFIATAFVAGRVRENMRAGGLGGYLRAAFAGFAVCYLIGLTYKYIILHFYLGEGTSLWLVFLDCFPLDMPGDVALSILSSVCAARLVPVTQNILHQQRPRARRRI